jgi:hypothetical protein
MELQPRIFHYSLDWRFLLPIADVKKICLVVEEGEDFRQTLEHVGIYTSQQLSLADLRQRKSNDAQSFVMPFGLPVDWVSREDEDQVAFYFSVRRLIASGGYLLVGFNNVWNLRANPQAKYYACTPRRIAAQLKQAGFQSIKIFGAMPNLAIPEYIFDLDPQTIQFALRNRFRRKPAVLRALHVLAGTIGLKRISNFLPCYFTVATA